MPFGDDEPHPIPTISSVIDAATSGVDDKRDFVRLLFKRIANAVEIKKRWEQRYEVNRSHDYVCGFQRPAGEEKDAQGDRRYQLNKILAAMKAKIPSIFYYNPYFRIKASKAREDTPAETVSARATLLQDTINSITRQPRTRFKPECLLALKESQWAFGMVEVGYSAEWGENPYAPKPPLVENEYAEKDLEKSGMSPEGDEIEGLVSSLMGLPPGAPPVRQDLPSQEMDPLAGLLQVPHNETFFVRYIPAKQFIVSSNDRSATETMDFVAYWEWHYVEDIKKTESYENTENLKPSAKASPGGGAYELEPMRESGEEIPADMVRIWKLWDLRTKTRYILADGHEDLLRETEFRFLPLYDLRPEIIPGEWYPNPPIYSQLMEQDEHNDGREFLRLCRKAIRPRYTYDKNAFKPNELEKLETDDMNTFVGVENANPEPIRPIQQPSLTGDAIRTLAMAEQGFTEATGVSAQDRQVRSTGGEVTATEISTLDKKGEIRDSYEQEEVANWLASVARGILSCAIEKMTLPQWVLINSDPYSPYFMVDAADIAKNHKDITIDQLQDADENLSWDVTVDIESMSPISESQQASRLIQFLNMLANPGLGRLLALSPELLKRSMDVLGIRNASDQKSIASALAARDQMELMMAGGGAAAPPPKGISPMPGQPTPPTAPPGPPRPEPAAPQNPPGRPPNGTASRPS